MRVFPLLLPPRSIISPRHGIRIRHRGGTRTRENLIVVDLFDVIALDDLSSSWMLSAGLYSTVPVSSWVLRTSPLVATIPWRIPRLIPKSFGMLAAFLTRIIGFYSTLRIQNLFQRIACITNQILLIDLIDHDETSNDDDITDFALHLSLFDCGFRSGESMHSIIMC